MKSTPEEQKAEATETQVSHTFIMSKTGSVFIDLPEMKEREITRSEHSFALLTYIPIVEGHTLVCPKRVVQTIDELSDVELLDLMS